MKMIEGNTRPASSFERTSFLMRKMLDELQEGAMKIRKMLRQANHMVVINMRMKF